MSEYLEWLSLAQTHKLAIEKFASKQTAELLLANALRAGKIGARGDFFMGEDPHPDIELTVDFWFDKENIIWDESLVVRQISRLNARDIQPNYLRLGEFHRIELNISDVNALWPGLVQSGELGKSGNSDGIQGPPKKGIGGAPAEYDWEKYLIEAAVFMHINGSRMTQQALFEHLWTIFGGRDGGPSPGSMKAHIGPLYRRFKQIDSS